MSQNAAIMAYNLQTQAQMDQNMIKQQQEEVKRLTAILIEQSKN